MTEELSRSKGLRIARITVLRRDHCASEESLRIAATSRVPMGKALLKRLKDAQGASAGSGCSEGSGGLQGGGVAPLPGEPPWGPLAVPPTPQFGSPNASYVEPGARC